MDESVNKPPFAWQPLTPRGVAAFARASSARLQLVQFLVALVAAGAVVWFLHTAWFPTVSTAIGQLPTTGGIRHGRLDWNGDTSQLLAENHFLALAVDLQHSGTVHSPAHVEIEFGERDFKIFSLLGFVEGAYPRQSSIAFNRSDLGPWWGAWAPALLAIAAGLVISGLMISWALLATVYCGAAWLVGFFANRELSVSGSWRLAGAALMPGALFLTAAIVLYGLGDLDLVRLAAAAGGHFVIGWIYLVVSPLWLPPQQAVAAVNANPFVPPANEPVKEPAKAETERLPTDKNGPSPPAS
jgi:hypothetical protein